MKKNNYYINEKNLNKNNFGKKPISSIPYCHFIILINYLIKDIKK